MSKVGFNYTATSHRKKWRTVMSKVGFKKREEPLKLYCNISPQKMEDSNVEGRF